MAGKGGGGTKRTGGRAGGATGGRTGHIGRTGAGRTPTRGGKKPRGGDVNSGGPSGSGLGPNGPGFVARGDPDGGGQTEPATDGYGASAVAVHGSKDIDQESEVPNTIEYGTYAGGAGSIDEEVQGSFGHVVGHLYIMVHNRVPDSDAANKIIDDTLATVGPYVAAWWHNHGSFEGLNPYFILNKAENRIQTYRRRMARQAAVSLDLLQEKFGQELPLRAPSVHEQVEVKLEVMCALAGLSDHQKLALVLRYPPLRVYLEDLSALEVAQIMNLDRNALDQAVHKAKIALQLGLDEQEELGFGT